MFTLTDEVIENTICHTSGLIVATLTQELQIPIEDVSLRYYSSRAYALLRDKETGYYWDSIGELMDLFRAELAGHV